MAGARSVSKLVALYVSVLSSAVKEAAMAGGWLVSVIALVGLIVLAVLAFYFGAESRIGFVDVSRLHRRKDQ